VDSGINFERQMPAGCVAATHLVRFGVAGPRRVVPFAKRVDLGDTRKAAKVEGHLGDGLPNIEGAAVAVAFVDEGGGGAGGFFPGSR